MKDDPHRNSKYREQVVEELGFGPKITRTDITEEDRVLFAEGGARIVVSVRAEQRSAWQALIALQEHQGVPVREIGTVADHGCFKLAVGGHQVIDLSVAQLRDQYEQAVPRRLGAV